MLLDEVVVHQVEALVRSADASHILQYHEDLIACEPLVALEQILGHIHPSKAV